MNFKFTKITLIYLLLGVCFLQKTNAQQNDSTKPWVFWYWMQAGVSKSGITADLEAMKASGIGGAYLMTIKGPSNPPVYQPVVNQLTPEWWDMVKFSLQEAKRLNLKIGMHVSDGFALAGGPWITPELSMQKIVWSQLKVNGGTRKIVLPQPPSKAGFYKDIAVYAYPSPIGSEINTQTIVPKVSSSNGIDAKKLIDVNNKENFSTSEPCWFQYEFEKAFTCRTIKIKTTGNNYQAQRLEVQTSNDGKTFKSLGRLEAPRHGWQDTDENFTFSITPTTARFFRFVYNKAGSEAGAEDLDAAKWKPALKILNLQLSAQAEINQYESKNGSVWRVSKRSTAEQIANKLCVPLTKLINLTGKLNADGSLNWIAPAGNWTILRVGHTSTGHKNDTGGAGIGLECDKFNPEAIKLQFNSWYGKAIENAGPELAKDVLTAFHVDSWECGSQNWSPVFKAEFLKRRGYDLTPYLPIMTGLPVESAAVSENFLYDVRKTISELVVDQFYGTLATLAKQNGVTFTAESVAPTMLSDGLMHYKKVDIPMGEFWLNSPTHDKPNDMLDAISGAHIYGKNIIQAEAFTTVRMDWNEHPRNLKTLQDRNFALGINKLVYHVFTHNPWTDRKPGMTLDGVGLYFQRDQTWWKQGKAWVDYAERCQTLLQQGKPVVDIAVFTGEELPSRSVLPDRLVHTLPGLFGNDVVEAEEKRLANIGEPQRQKPAGVTHSANMADPENWVNPLRGYAYDSFNMDVLSTATVKNGKVVFASGTTYSVLVFPGKLLLNPNYAYMSYPVVKKINDLVKAGAKIIVGDKPLYQTGIKQVNATQFNLLVNQIWGGTFTEVKTDDKQILMKTMGSGQVVKAPFYGISLDIFGLKRDLALSQYDSRLGSYHAKNIAYTHRKDGQKDIYFIANQENIDKTINLDFRVAGRPMKIYDPVKNEYAEVKTWLNTSSTTFEWKFLPNQSLFVIFEGDSVYNFSSPRNNWKTYKTTQDLSTDWQVKFDPAFGGPSSPVAFKTLTDWSKNTDTLIKYYSGTAIYSKKININEKNLNSLFINLGDFSAIAEVRVNGISCGTLWTPPFKLNIGKAIRPGENTVEIEVTNTWANRLIGDHNLPENKRFTKTTAPFRLEGKPLNPGGLFGPVTIEIEDK